jgi:hypothetical protein
MTKPTNPQPSPIIITGTTISSLNASPAAGRAVAPKARTATGVTVMYPLLLIFSTALAGAFCYLYLTKPVFTPPAPATPRVVMAPAQAPGGNTPPAAPPSGAPAAAVPNPIAMVGPPAPAAPEPAAAPEVKPPAPPAAEIAALLPQRDHLPGDPVPAPPPANPEPADPRQVIPAAASPFEETNLQVQHILTAEAANGALNRIVIDAPVLYQTGQLAWTEQEVAEARRLLGCLADHQEKTRALREEGETLLAAWHRLIQRSLPLTALRADSPAIPANQHGADDSTPPPNLDTTESIQLQPLTP